MKLIPLALGEALHFKSIKKGGKGNDKAAIKGV